MPQDDEKDKERKDGEGKTRPSKEDDKDSGRQVRDSGDILQKRKGDD